MSYPIPESTAPAQGDTADGDLFTNYARRITSLLCGSSDVNQGQTMADWEHFLRSSDSDLLSSTSGYRQHILAAHGRFLQSRQEALNETTLRRDQEVLNEIVADLLIKRSKASKEGTCNSLQASSLASSCTEDTEASTCVPTAERVAQGVDSVQVAASAAARSTMRCASMSAASSVIDSPVTSTDSCSSVHAINSSDGIRTIDTEESTSEGASPQQSCDTIENQASEPAESMESAETLSEFKRSFNWFRNPWHTRGSSDSSLGIGMAAESLPSASDEVSDTSHGVASQATFFLLRPRYLPGAFLHHRSQIDATPSISGDVIESVDASEQQSTVGERNVPGRSTGRFPGYGRSSPDGLTTGHSVGSSSQSFSLEDLLILVDSETELPRDAESPSREGALQEESRAPSVASLPSTVSLDSTTNPSWTSDSPEEEDEEEEALAASQEQILGMLPAGYHQSDDNLFGERQAVERSGRGQLTEEESDWVRAHHPLPCPLPEEHDVHSGSSPYLTTTASVISALECPVCFTFMRAPIWLCVNGHNVCGRCQQRVFTCPVCRGRLLLTRNLALEAISGDLCFKSPAASAPSVEENPQQMEATVEPQRSSFQVACAAPDDDDDIIIDDNDDDDDIEDEELPLFRDLDNWLISLSPHGEVNNEENSGAAAEIQNEQSVALDSPRPKYTNTN